MSGLILEGICAAGKTTMLEKISKSKAYIEKQTKIQLNEFMTERIIEYPKPTKQERINLLQTYVEIIEKLNSNFYNSRFKNIEDLTVKPCYLLERFHFTHAVEELDFESFKYIDKKLNDLNFKLVIFTVDKEKIKERLEDSLKRRNDSWYRYIMSFGGVEEASKKYMYMQEKLLEYSKLSKLDIKVINTSDCNWEIYTEDILKFYI